MSRFSEAMLKNLAGFGGAVAGVWYLGKDVETEEFYIDWGLIGEIMNPAFKTGHLKERFHISDAFAHSKAKSEYGSGQ